MKSEKAIISAKDYGSNTGLKSELTMNDNKLYQKKLQPDSRRELLEPTRLSHLPKLECRPLVPDFAPMPAASVCVNCKVRLDEYNQPLNHVNACRKCLSSYTVLDAEINEADKRKRRETLKKMIGGAK